MAVCAKQRQALEATRQVGTGSNFGPNQAWRVASDRLACCVTEGAADGRVGRVGGWAGRQIGNGYGYGSPAAFTMCSSHQAGALSVMLGMFE